MIFRKKYYSYVFAHEAIGHSIANIGDTYVQTFHHYTDLSRGKITALSHSDAIKKWGHLPGFDATNIVPIPFKDADNNDEDPNNDHFYRYQGT